MAYTEQITFLLSLKMADEQSKPPFSRKCIVSAHLSWQSLLDRDGDELEVHYRNVLEELGEQKGMLSEIFKKARPEIQNPSTVRKWIVNLSNEEDWSGINADINGDIYEELLSKSAAESLKGAEAYLATLT